MARTAINVTQLVADGAVAPSAFQAADAVNGMQVPAGVDGKLFLHTKYTDGAAGAPANRNVTIRAGVHGRSGLGNLVVSVPNGAERMVGPLESMRFEQADENIYVDFDGATGATVTAVRFP